ncbi:hypothetical protein Q6D67_06080 [Haliea sp. E1-2-M8]|uniref:hypothetical protein n=1 Tax=Haliea sp. E1-2-M8 TaxID=3064706 RepID=UPI0027273E7A|nr:hypothetical protein [Haliea sp. E1-2-M8]MDO8861265.1 hypothetical protein [Haliea sp. E1-2-M8]
MNRFNLSFRGEILQGVDPATAKLNFARLFAIHDPLRTEQFFSGKPVVLRRNLDPKRAASWQLQMRGLGLQAELTKQTDNTEAPAAESRPAPPPATPAPVPPTAPANPPPAAPATARAAATAPAAPVRGPARWAPNPYTLRPYQAGAAQRQRAVHAARLKQAGAVVAVVATIALALLVAGLRMLPAPAAVPPLRAAASSSGGELLLGTGKFLLHHDRSGAELETLVLRNFGVTGRLAGLVWEGPQSLLLLADNKSGGNLYRCQLEERQCRLLADESGPLQADAVTVIEASGQLIIADSARSLLSLHDARGYRLASSERPLPARPVLRTHGGLLLLNSTEGPGISVLRYEAGAFAQQLDEILLLPPAALDAGLVATRDFAWSGEQWWATLEDPETGAAGVFRFDALWNTLGQVAVPTEYNPYALVPWGTRMLVLDQDQRHLLRFSARGEPGVALVSPHLQGLADSRSRALGLRQSLGELALGLLALLALAATCFTLWQHLRQRVFAADRQRSAPPLENRTADIFWLPPQPRRPGRLTALLRRLGASQGHLGVLGKQLILVDHRGVYHVGNGIQLQRHPLFLRTEEVVLYTGPGRRRAFAADAWPLVQPALTAAGKADTGTIVVALLESRHPLALTAAGLLALALASAVLLLI